MRKFGGLPRAAFGSAGSQVIRFGLAALCVTGAWLVRLVLDPVLGDVTPWPTFFLAVLLASISAGLLPALFATLASALVGNLLFFRPRYSLKLGAAELVSTLAFSAVAAAIAFVGDSMRQARRRAEAEIEERRQIEKDLRASRALFAEVTRHSPAAVFIKDHEGRYVFVNALLERLFRRPADQWIGSTDFDLFPRDTAEVFQTNDRAVLAGTVPQEGIEEVTSIDGVEHYWLSYKFPFRDAEGRSLVGGVAVDITARKHAEQALRDADRKKDEFLAMLAHELRNPLGPIRNAVAVLRRTGPVEARQEAAHQMIDRQVAHMVRLIDDLLDVSRITQGKITLRKEPVLLSDVIKQATETVRPLVNQHTQILEATFPTEPLVLQADAARLVQVVSNLLNNAVKYTPAGGHVDLTADRAGDLAVIRVRDSGVGISPEVLPRIFDLFVQESVSLDRQQGGLGIGLTLVRRLVELHGGTISARSEGRGHGSEFIVTLPILLSTQPQKALKTDARQARLQQLRALIVEDNADAADSLAMLLELDGHETRIVHDGVAALELDQGFAPHIAFIDIGLPGMDGYEVARQLRQRSSFAGTLFVALSGYGRPEDKQQALQAGFTTHLTKPLDPDALQAFLADAFGGCRAQSSV